MGQALYRKYRSKSFAEVIGQEPITETLQKAISSGRISHAYLLSGPRGVGKTSVARILAHEVNGLPYSDESIHLDIIEIDAASNRRIDEIRDIREKVHIAPTSAKYKVYIIDEVHMLTKEAFNALLKTLEEPPAHCIFILATTEPHKLPETIISRTQRFNFKLADRAKAVAHLKAIAKKEKIDIEPAALELLVEHSEGSLRDSVSMLDQLSGAGKNIGEEEARQLLGLPPSDAITTLIDLVVNGSAAELLSLLTQLKEAGNSPALIASGLGKQLRSRIINTGTSGNKWTTDLLKSLLDVSAAKQPYELLEVALLEASMAAIIDVSATPKQPVVEVATQTPQIAAETAPIEPVQVEVPGKISKTGDFDLSMWPEILSEIKNRAASIYTALRLAEPGISDGTLILSFQFPLHKKKLEQSKHIVLIGEVIQEFTGSNMEVKCVLSEKPIKKIISDKVRSVATVAQQPSELSTISNIFGGAEVLES